MFLARGVANLGGTAVNAVGTGAGAVLTVATAGKAQWTQDMTKACAENTASCANETGKNIFWGGAGILNSAANLQLDPLAEQLFGVNDPTKHAQGRGHEQLQVFLVKQTDLSGMFSDMLHMKEHFTDNGAAVQCYRDVHKKSIRSFLRKKKPSLYQNKLLFLNGHGGKDTGFCMPDGHLNMEDILKWLEEGGFAGVLTLIVDSCYSGKFVKDMIKACRDRPEYLRKLHQYLDQHGHDLRIRIRASALASEESNIHPGGSTYTQSIVGRMASEYGRAEGSGNNWGLQFAKDHYANSADTVFGVQQCYSQTDLPVDFKYNGSGSWSWWCPKDREYLL